MAREFLIASVRERYYLAPGKISKSLHGFATIPNTKQIYIKYNHRYIYTYIERSNRDRAKGLQIRAFVCIYEGGEGGLAEKRGTKGNGVKHPTCGSRRSGAPGR